MSELRRRSTTTCFQQHHDGLVVVFSACILSIAAFILTLALSFDCRFYQVTTSTTLGHSMSIGLWKVQDMIRLDDNNDSLEDEDPLVVIQQGSCVGWNVFIQQPTEHHQMQLSDILDEPMVAARTISALLCLSCWIFPLLLFLFSFSPLKCMQLSTTALCGIVVGMLLAGILSLFSLVALSSELCTTAIHCAYGRDAVLAIVASLLWFVAAEFVAYRILIDNSSHEKSARSITPASPDDNDDIADIYLQDDGIPFIIATTTTTTACTTTNNNKTSTRHGHADDDNTVNHSMSIEEAADFDDGISALELPVIGPSIRYPVYDQHQHNDGSDGGGDDAVCYMYSSPPASIYSLSSLSRNQVYDYDASSSSSVVNNNNDDDDDDDDDDSFGNMYLTEAAPAAVSMLSISSSYTCDEQEEEKEEDGLFSSVMVTVLNRKGSDVVDDDDEQVELATI